MYLAAMFAVGGFVVIAHSRRKREVLVLAMIFALLWGIAGWALGSALGGALAPVVIAAGAFCSSLVLHAYLLRPRWRRLQVNEEED